MLGLVFGRVGYDLQEIGMPNLSDVLGEFFSGVVQPGYRGVLFAEQHQALLAGRTELTFQQYEDIYNYGIPTDGGEYTFAQYRTGPFRFAGIRGHKRIYEKA